MKSTIYICFVVLLTSVICVFADAFDDYNPQNTTMVFSANVNKSCVIIPIVNDLVVEQVESFEVTLERTPGLDEMISIYQDRADIIIPNDDGEVYIICTAYEVEIITIFTD